MSIIDLTNDQYFKHYYILYPTIQIKEEIKEKIKTYYFRVKCKCGNYTNWFNELNYFNKRKYILQCENCDPTDYKIAVYEWNGKCWELLYDRIKCTYKDCLMYMGVKPNEQLADIVQCEYHDPSSDSIKYRRSYDKVGWEIYRIKVHNGKRYVWKKPDL